MWRSLAYWYLMHVWFPLRDAIGWVQGLPCRFGWHEKHLQFPNDPLCSPYRLCRRCGWWEKL